MSFFKCKMCGGALEVGAGDTVVTCEYCGTRQTLPKLDDEKRANMYDRANHFRRNNEFDKAMSIYEQILNEDNTDAEAYWSIVLCRYGIEYVEDPATRRRVPTVNRAQYTSILADEDYKSALSNADAYQKSIYELEAQEIDKIQKGILAISSKEEPFDVFICYKETDNNGRRTPDSVLAQELYYGLKNEGFKVFFSRITLEDKLGSAYEPYIFAALNSSQVMIVLGTKPEYFNAVWVKNEWGRYLVLIKLGHKKTLIPAYKDMDPYDLPEEFSHLQAQDMSKLGFMQDLIRGIKKIVKSSEPKATTVVKETIVTNANPNTAPLLRRAYLFLEDGDWNSAYEYAEKILDIDPEHSDAYIVELLVDLKLRSPSQLPSYKEPIDHNPKYIKALRFAKGDARNTIAGYNQAIVERIDLETKTQQYDYACSLMNDKCYDDAISNFSVIKAFKDSEDKIEICKQNKENDRKEAIYAHALRDVATAYADDKVLKKSIAALETIKGYKNADAEIEKLQARLAKWYEDKRIAEEKARIKAEQERQEAERLAELRRIKAEQEKMEAMRLAELRKIKAEQIKKKAIRIAKIGIPSLAALILVIVLSVTLFIPLLRYSKADKLFVEGKYDEANSIYRELDGFGKSNQRIRAVVAIDHIKNKDFEDGIKTLLGAGVPVELTYQTEGGSLTETQTLMVGDTNSVVLLNAENETTTPSDEQNVFTFNASTEFTGLKTPGRNGYRFLEWVLESYAYDVETKDAKFCLTLKATWSTKDYVVEYDLAGGTVSETNIAEYDPEDAAFTLINPTRVGYTFAGWVGSDLFEPTIDVTVPTGSYGDRAYTATWTPNEYTVTYDAAGGTISSKTQKVTYDSVVEHLIPKRTGYTFLGWYENTIKHENKTWTLTTDLTLVAKWTPVTYSIKYVLNSAANHTENPSSFTFESDTITLKDPTLYGHEFLGWTYEGQTTPIKAPVISKGSIGNKTFTANWKPVEALAPFTYTATDKSITITGLKDKNATEVAVPQGVTHIGSSAFSNCTKLTTVTIPNSVTSIGPDAFYGCTNLTSLTLPFVGATKDGTSNTHFGYIFGASSYSYNSDYVPTSLKTVVITDGTSIASSAFYGCSGITSITVSNSVTSIGSSAFRNCSSLTSITLPFVGETKDGTSNTHFGYIFGESSISYSGYSIPTSLKAVVITDGTSIGSSAFNGCTGLTSITIPNSVTSIGASAFRECTGLKSISIPNGVTNIGNYAFYKCTGITSIFIPNSVTNIGEYAFSSLNITSITVPNSVTSIGQSAFYNCEKLTSITLPFVGATKDGTTNMLFGYIFGATSYDYNGSSVPSSLKTVIITDAIRIGANAFYDCSGLTSITLPDSVTSIGSYAFYLCTGLTSFTVPNGVTSIETRTFSSCGLTSVTIPSSVTSIGQYAFYQTGLTSVTIPNGVTTIYNNAFQMCSKLTSVTIADSVKSIGKSAFSGCTKLQSITLPFVGGDNDGTSADHFGWIFGAATSSDNKGYVPTTLRTVVITSADTISSYAFYNCTGLTSITIPNGVKSIGTRAFAACTGLTKITIPSSVTNIGQYAFYQSGLTIVTIPDGVAMIDVSAFRDCSNLTSVTIADSVTEIRQSAFAGCDKLKSITLPFIGETKNGTTNTHFGYIFGADSYSNNSQAVPFSLKTVKITNTEVIGAYAFRNCTGITSITLPNGLKAIENTTFCGCSALTSITIPSSVTRIGQSAFNGCTKLSSITIPNGVTCIEFQAFIDCTALKSVTIPNSVTMIDEYAFSGCTGLTSITIPNSVLHINYYAFSGCTSLTSITIPNSVTEISYGAFKDCTGLTSITLPFVGQTNGGTNNTHFGYIFGAPNYDSNDDCVPASLKTVVITGGTSIDTYAFYGCTGLTSITIPNSVSSIGYSAFSNCTGLTSITLPFVGETRSGTTNTHFGWAFGASSSYYNVHVPKSLKTVIITDAEIVDSYAFSQCSNLTSITLPNSVTSIGSWAFEQCTSLTSITMPNAITKIEHSAFYYCTSLKGITIPNTVTSIEAYTFVLCSSLTSITIPESVTSIGYQAFYGCTGLTSITIPNSVTSIGQNAFKDCTGLTSITLPFVGETKNGTTNTDFSWIFNDKTASSYSDVPQSLKTVVITDSTSIASNAFERCHYITNITIPDSVTSIGDSAFADCHSLTSIVIPNSVTSIGSGAFYGCTSLTNITIPNSVTSIGASAFYGCSGLTSITIPTSVTSIGEKAFSYCSGLTNITIPDSVTIIESAVFANCRGVTSVTIPSSVTSIETEAFSDCALTSITFNGTISQWYAISRTRYWNHNTGNYTIYCTDGIIAKNDAVTYY